MEREPEDASAYHNLGTVCLRLAKYPAAVEAYRQSLRLRPASPVTCVHLGYALKESGQRGEAMSAWQEALRLAPGYAAALEALHSEKQVEQ